MQSNVSRRSFFKGAGLAAPQVGILRRAVIVLDDNEEFLELINPEIILQEGEQEGAAKVIGTSIGWMVLLGAAASIITSVFMEPMLYLFGATELIMPYAAPYARLICIGLFFGILSSGLSYFIRADGSPQFASYVLVAGAVFNMVFDPLFLFVFDMGMTGIALATLLGQLLSTILALYYMFKRFHSVTLSPRHLRPSGHAGNKVEQ